MFSTSLSTCPRVPCLQALIHGGFRLPHLFSWKITVYTNRIKSAKKCVLVGHGSPYPITPIKILQPAELTLGNTVLVEAIPSSIVLMEEIPSFTKPLMSLHFGVINKEALKLTVGKVLGDRTENVGGYRPALKERTAGPREITHSIETQGGQVVWC